MARLVVIGIVLASCLGCSSGDGVTRASVSGKVTLDGAPIEKGTITLVPAEGTKGPAVGGAIQHGSYTIPAAQGPVLGKYQFQVSAPRKTGRKVKPRPGVALPPSMADKEFDEIVDLPERYNTQSTLIYEINAGKNTIDLSLTSE